MSKVVEMKGNKDVFTTVMDNLRKVGNKSYFCIKVSSLSVDKLYQRIETRSKEKINRMANNWCPAKMDALKVVPHPETFTFSVVDGYGRLMAASILGIDSLECEVLLDAPEDIIERRKYEANIFLDQTKYVETLRPVQMHNARLVVKDDTAVILENIADEYNVKVVAVGHGRRAPGVLGSYAVAYEITKAIGEAGLRFIFEVCKVAGYNFELNGYNSYVFRSLRRIYQAYHCEPKIIGEYMRTMKPTILKAKAVASYPERCADIALTLYLQDYYVGITGVHPVINEKGKIVA